MSKEVIGKIINKFIPDPEIIKNHKSLQFLGNKLHDPNLWYLNRRSVSMAFAVGLFSAWIPIPAQMAISATAAVYFRSHIPISVALVWITNALTVPPLFYFAYQVGLLVLNQAPAENADFSVENMLSGLGDMWLPLLVGCFIVGVISSASGYFGIKAFWIYQVKKKWAQRHERRGQKNYQQNFYSKDWRK
jgi:uncharacterized protein (DUF2062 family)